LFRKSREPKPTSTSISNITTALQAVVAIVSAVRAITVSMRSVESTSRNDNGSEQNHKGSGLGVHKWILIAGAVVGVMTIAYLENIASNSKPMQNTVNEKPKEERFETVYVNS
jgi:hypothetical protein